MPTDAAIEADRARSAGERLLEDSWEARARRASRRELLVEVAAGGLFVAAAGALVALTGVSGLKPLTATILLAVYMAVARVEFPVGAGHVVPTQLVLVPMLVLLPPAAVPVLVAIALVASTAHDCSRGRSTARRLISAVPDAWHALGAALALVALGPLPGGIDDLPPLVCAFGACCAVDLLTSLARMRLSGLAVDIKAPVSVMAKVCAVDACLAPVGFAIAYLAEHGIVAILLVLPLALLLWGLARDRNQRIEQAHARLSLVQRERTRLQAAVRRLGDAFAAKLELDALFETLLHGAVEALDAAGGRLELDGLPTELRLSSGSAAGLAALDPAAGGPACPSGAGQAEHEGGWVLSLPVSVAGRGGQVSGALRLARPGRAFEPDEVALVAQLIDKAQLAASEILRHETLREQAVTDALTGLGNRRQLSHDLVSVLERAGDRPSVLLLFDLDGFKAYNDTFGHLAGDALLSRLGAKLAGAVQPAGAAYRLGGDEFCALVGLPDPDALDGLIRRAADALCETGGNFRIGASLGAVLIPHEVDSVDHALQLADERMYANKRTRSRGARDQARDVLMRTMEAKQPELDHHSSHVAVLAVRVAHRLGLSGEALDEIARAAELHDVGKVGIPDAILNKPGQLDAAEWEFMHKHTILGERILNAAPALRPVARLVRASHERWDGSGYPDALRGDQIPFGARIVAVCDAYEAITADRPYRTARSHADACRELVAAAGTQFDPSVVAAFLATIETDSDEPDTDAVQIAAAHVRTLLARA